jgi:MoxR-like ATPase
METFSSEEAMRVRDATRKIIAQIERVIVGKHETIELVVMAMLARGHVLIEDIPGVGKTMLAKATAKAIGGSFKRIQFTPDLLPGDVTGLSTYNQKTTEFLFNPGPVFANVVLADEINRATPKTQSALLESMEEAQVTVEGTTRPLPQPFFVLATQNPVEYRGTYPLPEAQMDRFLMRLRLGYPQPDEEVEMLERHFDAIVSHDGQTAANQAAALLRRVEPVMSIEEVNQLRLARARVHISPAVRNYIVAISTATRSHLRVLLGASPRASLAMQRVAQSSAILQGREYATPDDVKRLVPYVLPHRLILHEESGREAAEAIVAEVLETVPVP